MKVSNMVSNKGNDVPNQFIIETPTSYFFQSYKSIIVEIVKPTEETPHFKVYLDLVYYDYSRTTVKYRNMFLSEKLWKSITSKEVKENIKNGTYFVANLN
jgi:hypothetical protein